jgi:hypothetical protein
MRTADPEHDPGSRRRWTRGSTALIHWNLCEVGKVPDAGTRHPKRSCPALLVVLLVLLAPASGWGEDRQPIPAPAEFFGFPMGAERQLAGWDRIADYFDLVGRLSDRVTIQEMGKTTMGNRYLVAVISSPEAIADLPRYRAMQKKLADPRRTSEDEALRIAREGRLVLLVGANVHATEIGSSQMAVELVYRMATEDSPWMRHVLSNVILLLIPSQNPDGQQMVVDWYYRNLGTPYEDSPLPELYHKYTGHDNNRDSYMLTQVESQHLARLTYHEWLPEVYLDKHQMGSGRARIFVPPFKDPPNPNIDPLVWSQVNLLGQAMAAKLHEAGKPGVLWGEAYTGFWQGANSTNPWWHNMVALLTEVASARLATTIVQDVANPAQPRRTSRFLPDRSRGDRDPHLPLPAPTDVHYRMNYLEPWLGGTWSLADVVEYQMLATTGLLEAVANNREMLKRNFYVMNRRTIERFEKGSPYAYLVPPVQRDPVAAAKLLQLIQAGGGEVHRADEAFSAGEKEYPAGTYVLRLAQPFGRWIKDLLEPQQYPQVRSPGAGAPVDRPYDVTAWTLGMLMGVETMLIQEPFEARLSLVRRPVAAPPGRLVGRGTRYVLNHEVNNSFIAVNRLLKTGAEIRRATDSVTIGGRQFSPGAMLVSDVPAGELARLAEALSLEILAADEADLPAATLVRAPRIAVFEPWGGNMDAGWTRWLLEQHEFPYTHARNDDLRQPDLLQRFDVIVFPEMSVGQIVRGQQARHVRPEYRGGIGDEGIRNLREFVRQGGTIVTLGNAAQFAIDSLGAPLENVLQGTTQESFYCPGSILRVTVDRRHPIGWGMPAEADVMFVNNSGYVPLGTAPPDSTRIIGQYPQTTLLRSGFIVGESKLRGAGAVLEVASGRGRIIVHAFRVQSRGQTWGTFRLLFNSLLYGASPSGRAMEETQ